VHPNKVRRQSNADKLRERRKDIAERRAKAKADRAARDEAKDDKGKASKAEKADDDKSTAKDDKAEKSPAKTPAAKPKPRRIVYKDVPKTPLEDRLDRALDLKLTARGPYKPWRVTLRNAGAESVRVFEDVRLVWFEAKVPGRKKPTYCKLPDGMLPKVARDRSRVLLNPEESISFKVDPRLFCFEGTDTSILVPGAFVRAHYGWQENGRFVWDKGRQRRLRLAQKAPYLAKPVSKTEDGLKEVASDGLALGNDYIEWAKTRIHGVNLRPHDDALVLTVSEGSDVQRGSSAWVKVTVKNHSREPQRIFLRRELLSFTVRGPTGKHQCQPEQMFRAPDAMNLQRLAPGKDISMTVRLGEFCDADVFSAPGLYYVSAHLPLPPDDEDEVESPESPEAGEDDEIGAANRRSGSRRSGGDKQRSSEDRKKHKHRKKHKRRALRADKPRPVRIRSGETRFHYDPPLAAAMGGAQRGR
jgi:hypothetical protein